jgi:hypothetical protein
MKDSADGWSVGEMKKIYDVARQAAWWALGEFKRLHTKQTTIK